MIRLIVVFVLLPLLLTAENKNRTIPAVVVLPDGPLTRIPSPNKNWTLVFECPADCTERELSIERTGSKQRQLVSQYERSLSVSWAPDSQHFFVYDAAGSNEGSSYVYGTASLNRLDLAEAIRTHDRMALPFLKAGHSYVRAKYWINSHDLIVILTGHFDEGPPHSFTLKYQIGTDGSARRLSIRNSEQP